ncbi:hypothetical protein B9Z55_019104 [Caenorhabditis nigoni]|uniref:Uncharacterized protein n=1 Tax=Caenorhabditis nigoni TaxID=1611254 RepID=A0A2G5TH57_9PELO|nr:hypothetical protein B9Z55_019104 [Caenorhabditis nigoni]
MFQEHNIRNFVTKESNQYDLQYPYSLLQLYSKYNFEKGREINVVLYLGAAVISFLILMIVYRVNKKKVKERRFKGPISEAYQVRENIRTSRLLLKIFIIFSVFVGLSTFFLLRFSASLTDPKQKWVTITNGFLYDMLISTGTTTTTIVFLHFLIPDETQKKWSHILHLPCYNRNVTPESKRLRFKSIHGVDVDVGNGTVRTSSLQIRYMDFNSSKSSKNVYGSPKRCLVIHSTTNTNFLVPSVHITNLSMALMI